ncbi:MAG: glycosyltransferase family 39 protein [bacterium]|nr:glycosyltransferase family 39 protein [bacterium]
MQRHSNYIAVLMLAFMLALMIGSSWNDSATFDEVAHIPSGYTALKYQDSRLNPEHPPLIKDLAAFPLLFMNLKFELRPDFWQNPNVNDRQWQVGHALLYEFGNDPDKILFAARLPIMLLAVIFGWLFFVLTKKQYGSRVGLLTLFFYCFSPTVLAHSRYVTTDIGAAFGFFLGIVFFLKFLERPDWKRTIWLGLVLGTVLMFKFSLILLLPVYGILFVLWVWVDPAFAKSANFSKPAYSPAGELLSLAPSRSEKFRKISAFANLLLAGFLAIAVIWVVYAYHTWNYPTEQNLTDVQTMLTGYKIPFVAGADTWLVAHPITRPLGQYLFGFLMTARRTAGGNTAYFLGEVSAKGWHYYFPAIYLTKEQLGFHLFSLLALFFAVQKIKRGKKSSAALKEWISDNFPLVAGMVFIAVYWIASVANPLNIGIRHILPTFPFIYLLVSREIIIWLSPPALKQPRTFLEWIKAFYESYLKPVPKYFFVFLVLFLMALNILGTFPYYLSFFNILGGGTEKGYYIATDSNYDWGQDLKRLSARMKADNISHIYLDYFGGGDPNYYLGTKFKPWWSAKGPPPAGSYFAVSLNSLAGAQAWYNSCLPAQVGPDKCGDATIKPEDTYSWLKNKTPVARGGMSILIFKIN